MFNNDKKNKLIINQAEPRVALLTPNDSSYVVATWASWISNCVVVPLHSEYPVGVLRYYLDDAGVSIVVASESMKHLAEALVDDVEQNPTSFASADAKCKPRCVFMPEDHGGDLDQESLDHLTDPTFHQPTILDEEYEDLLRRDYFASKRALIIYTSGSTGPPKGVVLTHGNIAAQVDNMVSAWEWSGNDLLLHVLPLHHVHGIVNCLYTPLQVPRVYHGRLMISVSCSKPNDCVDKIDPSLLLTGRRLRSFPPQIRRCSNFYPLDDSFGRHFRSRVALSFRLHGRAHHLRQVAATRRDQCGRRRFTRAA